MKKRTIFRDKALKHYAQSWERVILPRFVAPPVFLFLWILLGLLLVATLLAWLGQIPAYATGAGIVLDQRSTTDNKAGDKATAVIFLPASPSLRVQTGLSVRVQIGQTGPRFNTTIVLVEPDVISPSAARQRYGLNGNLVQVITQPSIVVIVGLGPTISAEIYAGSLVSAQVQVGTQRVLSLLPGVGQLIGA